MNIDAFELQQILNNGGRAVLGSTGSTRDSYNSNDSTRTTTTSTTGDAEIIAYMRTRIASEGLNTIDKLSNKLGSGAKWALDNNQTSHPLWKYAAVNKAKGQSAADAALKSDITKWASQLFGTSSSTNNTSTGITKPEDNTIIRLASEHEIIAYMKTRVANEKLDTIDKLTHQLGSSAKWVGDNEQRAHPLWSYAKVIKSEGQVAGNAKLKEDITKWAIYLFDTPENIEQRTKLAQDARAFHEERGTFNRKPTLTTVVPLQTPAKQAGFGDDLFNNKPLMYGVGAVAAAGLVYALLK